MAESTKSKRDGASSTKSSPSRSTKKTAKQSVSTTARTAEPKRSQTKAPEVIVHQTSSGPTSTLKTGAQSAFNSVLTTVRQRIFWLWVGGVVATLLVVLLGWWQWQRSYVAVVNGQYVPTSTLYSQLMASGGAETLNNLTQQQLILQQAQRENVAISNSDIQKELDAFKESTGGEDQYRESLKEFGISEELLRNQIEVRLTLEKILADEIKVSDQEIEDYYNANKEEVDVANEGLEGARERIETQLREQKLSQESANYIESIQQNASVQTMPHHASLTFVEFLNDEVLSIPNDVWRLVAGSNN